MKGKRIRDRGKLRLSNYFKSLSDGDRVAIVKALEVRSVFPKRLVGTAGKIIGARGRYNLVELKDGNKTKTFIIHPIHLKKLK
jgi:large subunit ribosomal protein L21e